ncbi:response regulator [Nitrososphaera sp.]|uniref:response regulator n=1 Tax=Nitrososphaera sp. TaxID=1971748 RepID=UPI00307F927F
MVDDERDILLSMKIALERHVTTQKMTVDTFSNPIKALEHWKANPNAYDLLLIDIRMPGMSGIEFSREVRKINQTVKIALITAYAIDKKELDLLLTSLKVDAFITKPISLPNLIELLQSLLVINQAMPKESRADSKKTILIGDVEQELLELYTKAFNVKYNIITAKSGVECIGKYVESVIKGKDIDLVLLDYGLPDMPGSEVAERLKELGASPIVLISAYELDKYMVAELKRKKVIESALMKPISISSLFREIDAVVS